MNILIKAVNNLNGGDGMSDIDILSQIVNLKEDDYKNTLLLTGIIEVLVEKNIISKKDLIEKVREIDTSANTNISHIGIN
jgi:hypothetical protein